MKSADVIRGFSAMLLGALGPLFVAGWLIAGAQSQEGPKSEYYVTSGNHGITWILRRSKATAFDQIHSYVAAGYAFGEHAIVVDKTIRTLGTNAPGSGVAPSPGAEYTRRGKHLGTTFPYPATLPDTSGVFDATTDGEYIYALDYYGATVWRLNLDWTEPVKLFEVLSNDIGITYDPSNGGSLWVSSSASNETIRQYTLSGVMISSFPVPTGASALARDPHDDTLWFSAGVDGTFYQYSTTGQLLGSITYPTLAGRNYLGGEFRFSRR